MRKLALAFIVLFMPAALPASAQQSGVELGLLDCVIEGGTGFILGSTKDVSCTFEPADKTWAPEAYFGVVNRYGLDVGYTKATMMRWAVLASSRNVYAPGALAGDYVGASAEVTAAGRAGAKLLGRGPGQNSTPPPPRVQTQTGLDLAVGVSQFQLRSTSN